MSICANCQNDNPEGARFCRGCGMELSSLQMPELVPVAEVSQQAEQKIEQKPKKKRVGLIVAVVVLVLLLAAAAVWFFVLRDKQEYGSVIAQEGSLAVLGDHSSAAVYHNGEQVLEDVTYESSEISLDGNSAAILADGCLWYCDNGQIEKVTKDAVSFYDIASLGGALIYQTEDGLFYYDAAEDDSKEVTDETVNKPMISGKGSYVAYFVDDTLFRWDGKKTVELAEVETMALSSLGEDGSVATAKNYVHADGEVEVCRISNIINADGTQRFFDGGEGLGAYIVDEEIRELDDVRALSWVSYKPEDIRALLYTAELYRTPQHLKTLTDQFYYAWQKDGEKGLYYLNEEMELVKIDMETEGYPNVIDFDSSYVPSDRYVYFLEGCSLPGKENPEYRTLHRVDRQTMECEEITDNVYHVEAAKDGIVYYVTYDLELYRYDGETKERLLKDVDDRIAVDEDGTALAVDRDGKLYRIGKKSEPEKVEKNVTGVYRDGQWFYCTNDEGNVYISEDGKDFEKLGEGDLTFGNYYQ